MKRELLEAVAERRLNLHYQPKFRLDSGELQGVEALLRWRSESGAWIAPAVFTPILERSGAIHEVCHWVFERAATDSAYWLQCGHDVRRIAINISPVQLRGRDGPLSILDLCTDWPAGKVQLDVELTESALIANNREVVDLFKRLSERNVIVALDDFGCGYSSLSLLADLPVDHLKIDRTFTSLLLCNRRVEKVVQAIVGLAHELGMKIVAEGIETIDQLNRVRALGIEIGQGFLFSRALDRESLLDFLALATPALQRSRGAHGSSISRV
ncbi:hypothetical protein ACG33_07540 [Steroidobacter denitrificans]|uniref:EAL domain-containing protein n=1 Tax=Steroidobacter denitrificans TaxID=465721 RepID=A0A127FBD6_STEDE|nr:EAL domain-containing protein [Steroidobacter denitrificans]AMN46951.1 hypothetical protein ACG33_07540 [Steroidobacter denitrificans]